MAEVDSVRLIQLIDNLLTNAIKYSPVDGNICIILKQHTGDFELRVEDTGPGILQEELDELFAPYSKLSSIATGGEKSTGLGLAIAKKVVQAHHGLISYEPSQLGGSCFKVTMPLIQEF